MMTIIKDAKVITGFIISVLSIIAWFLVHTHGEKTKVKKTNANPISISQTAGPVLINNNQSGGQFAQNIVNMGPQPRTIEAAAASRLADQLKLYSGERYCLQYLGTDPESLRFARQIESILSVAGWKKFHEASVMSFRENNVGIQLFLSPRKPSFTAFENGLKQMGVAVTFYDRKLIEDQVIFVGSSSTP